MTAKAFIKLYFGLVAWAIIALASYIYITW